MRVKLSGKVLNHIVARHPEVSAYTHIIVETVCNPDLIVRGLKGELKAKVLCRASYRAKASRGCLPRALWRKGYYNCLLYF